MRAFNAFCNRRSLRNRSAVAIGQPFSGSEFEASRINASYSQTRFDPAVWGGHRLLLQAVLVRLLLREATADNIRSGCRLTFFSAAAR